MRRPILLMTLLMTLAACSQAPQITWPAGPEPATPRLLPTDEIAPPAGQADPGPGLAARGSALRRLLGL
jgi:hypothetical protein